MPVYDISGNIISVEPTADLVTLTNGINSMGESMAENNNDFASDEFMRIVMLDCNYKYFSVANVKRIIDQMNTVGLNYLEIGFGGSGRGCCFKLNDMTIEANGTTYELSNCVVTDFGSYWNEEDMETIMAYARSKGIDIIPLFNVPGHFRPFLANQPQFRYGTDIDSLDINNPAACEYALAVCELYIKWFANRNVKFWNFGADEFGDITAGYTNLHDAGNYSYADFLNRLAYIVASYRMVPMAWNDPYLIRGDIEPLMNRRTVINYWNKAASSWASASVIQADGHNLINSSMDIYWVANGQQVTEAQMQNFNIHSFRGGSTISNPIGACFCIWIGTRESPALNDDGSGITTAVLPLIAAFGETIASQIN